METFGLLFLEPERNDPPGSPISHVYVKTCTRHEYRGIMKDLALLTPQANTAEELGQYIDGMCEELQKIKREAVRNYGAARRRRG